MPLVKRTTVPDLLSDFFDRDNFFENSLEIPRIWKPLEPSANIKENGKEYHIDLAVPGMKKDDFKVEVDDNDMLTISAEKKSESKEEDEHYTRHEFNYNSFKRSFRLPEEVKSDKIKAKYENGILSLEIPKKAESKQSKAKEIKIS